MFTYIRFIHFIIKVLLKNFNKRLSDLEMITMHDFENEFQEEVNTFLKHRKFYMVRYAKYIFNKINSLDYYNEKQNKFLLKLFSVFNNFISFVSTTYFPNENLKGMRLNYEDIEFVFGDELAELE